MATYYFDNTSPIGTAGFGTLTGNWTDAKWSLSGAGTSATGIAWPGAGNIATFGGTSNTAVGNTLTAAGTISLDGIVVQNLSTTTTQTLTGGTLAFGAVNATISTGATGSGDLSIASTVTGTNGFIKAGGGNLFFTGNTAATSGLSGTITHNAGLLIIQPTTTPVTAFGASTVWNLSSLLLPRPNVANGVLTINGTSFTGSAGIQHNSDLGFNTTTNIVGTVNGIPTVKALGGSANATINTIDFPSSDFILEGGSGFTTVVSGSVTLAASQSNSCNLSFTFQNAASSMAFRVNGPAYTATLAGVIRRTDITALTLPLTLGGTGTLVINGATGTNSGTGVTNLSKVESGTVVLNGNNSAPFGNSTVSIAASGGTLQVGHANALGTVPGSPAAVTMGAGSAFAVAGSITFAKPINAVGTIRNVSGNNTLTGGLTLAGTTTIESQTDTLTLNSASNVTGAGQNINISGAGNTTVQSVIATTSGGITKSDTGTLTLTSTANSFTGTVTINAGTVDTKALALNGSSSSIGAGTTVAFPASSTGFLKYTGTSVATTNRGVTFGGSITNAGLDSSATSDLHSVTFSGTITPTGTNTIALKGSNTGFNTVSGAVTGSNGFDKSGAGRWILTGANDLTGATTVSAGTLMAANAAGGVASKLFGGAVTVSGGKIQTGTAGGQNGRCYYSSLTFSGGSIRIGGVATSPTVYLNGNLDLPSPGTTTWDLANNALFRTPGTYTLFVFGAGFGLTYGGGTPMPAATVLNPTYVTFTNGPPSPRTVTATYNSPGGGSPNTITVTIS